jgi:hypothetical protein
MSLSSIAVATWLLLLGLVLPSTLSGQTLGSDTTAPSDTQPARADSIPLSGVYHAQPDTARQGSPSDTVAGDTTTSDTAGVASDTVQSAAGDSAPAPHTSGAASSSLRSATDTLGSDTSRVGASAARRTDTASASAAPADSILSAACGGTGGASTIAPDLLVVVFAPEASPGERAAVAEAVDGKLLGPVIGQPGAYYIRLPPGSEEPGLRAAADQLIRLTQVRQVGSRSCPSATGT